jgi:hypothetical protein
MKTERMIVLVTPEQKAAILTRAQSLGLSAGEMVRRAVESYEPTRADEAALDALGMALQAAAKDARKALAAATRELGITLDQLGRKRRST